MSRGDQPPQVEMSKLEPEQAPQVEVPKSEKDWEKWKDKYEERREMIAATDEEIIKLAGEKGSSFKCATGHLMYSDIHYDEENKFLYGILNNRPLIEIGGAEYHAQYVTAMQSTFRNMNKKFLIPEVVNVDPYEDQQDIDEASIDNWVKRGDGRLKMSTTEEERKRMYGTFHHSQLDGLSYLKKRDTASGNIFISSIDYSLIEVGDYHKRIAQEAFRVLSERDVLICCNSREIEREAEKLFPYVSKRGSIKIFSKSELPATGTTSISHLDVEEIDKEIEEMRSLMKMMKKEIEGVKEGDEQYNGKIRFWVEVRLPELEEDLLLYLEEKKNRG